MDAAREIKVNENTTFQSKWTLDYFLVCIKGFHTSYIICDGNIRVLIECNIKRLREAKTISQLSGIQSQLRRCRNNTVPNSSSTVTKLIEKYKRKIGHRSAYWFCSFFNFKIHETLY